MERTALLKRSNFNTNQIFPYRNDLGETFISSEYEGMMLTSPTLRMKIVYDNVTYKVQANRKTSGSIVPGELTAIIGPSGAGKTTLLHILAGYKTKLSSGTLTVNGQPRNDAEFRKCCAYIMQEDAMLPNLTVFESMMVSANLRLHGFEQKYVKKQQRVTEILRTLGLEDVANSNISDLSGGQRKRVSIALELVSNPPVIFLDEPTSGLDSHAAFQCISLMKSLVKQGRTICCTIHQPSARLFELFEKVVVLANGLVIYSGSTNDVINYFSTLNIICPRYHNPADFSKIYLFQVLEVSSGYYCQKVEILWEKWNSYYENESSSLLVSRQSSEMKEPVVGTHTNDVDAILEHSNKSSQEKIKNLKTFILYQIFQLFVLTQRSLRASIRDKMFTYLRLATTVAIALLLGALFYDIGNDGANVINNLSCIFFTMIYLIFICLMPTVLSFPLEKNVFIREHLNNWYALKVYYLAKTISDLPFQLLEAQRMFNFFLVIIMSVLTSQSIGLLLGACAPNMTVAVFVAPVSGIPLLLFCGYFVKYSVIPKYLRWFTYASYVRYCWEGAVLALYGGNRGELDCKHPPCMFRNGDEVLKFLDVNENALGIKNFRFKFCIINLTCLFVILRILTYIILQITIRNKKK